MAAEYRKGSFTPKNPRKYKRVENGLKEIIYRSGWELTMMKALDENPNVLEWSSEVPIPYFCSIRKNPHRYFVDFWVKTLKTDGTIECGLIEIKPAKEQAKPKEPKRKSKKYLREAITYQNNQDKWKAAEAFAKKRGWYFKVMNQYDLGLAQRPIS